MKRIILLFSLLGYLYSSTGQTPTAAPELSNLMKIDLGLQGIGLTYEPRLSKKITVDLSAGAGGGYDIAEGSIKYRIYFFKPAFYFSVTPKYFYNRHSRSLKEKTTYLNSGNYFGIRLKYITPNDKKTDCTRNSILVNAHWGVQRAFDSHWIFNAHAGVGYAQDIDYGFGTIYPSIDVKISYALVNLKK